MIIFTQSIFVINMRYWQSCWQSYGNVNGKDDINIDENWFNALLMLLVGNDCTKSLFSTLLNAESVTMECELCRNFILRSVLYTPVEMHWSCITFHQRSLT